MTILTILLIYACTFVGCNGKMQDSHKAGFYIVVGILSLVSILLT
jgi:hypothetical protein